MTGEGVSLNKSSRHIPVITCLLALSSVVGTPAAWCTSHGGFVEPGSPWLQP
jgi:hypothetical protein